MDVGCGGEVVVVVREDDVVVVAGGELRSDETGCGVCGESGIVI